MRRPLWRRAAARIGSWLYTNLVGLLALIVVTVANRDTLTPVARELQKQAGPVIETIIVVAAVIVYFAAAIAVSWSLGRFLRLLRDRARRLAEHYYLRHVQLLGVVYDILTGHEKRLASIGERLRIGSHRTLNLPDNLVPELIEYGHS